MRKNVVITGIVILVIGIALIAAGVVLIEKNSGINFSEQNIGNGKWAKAPIYVNSTGDIVVVSAHTTAVYLIPYNDYNSSISQSTAKADSIQSNSNSSTSGITSLSFTNLSAGEYAAISFSSSDPQLIVVVSAINGLLTTGLLVIAGGLMFIIGLIVAIYGLLKKTRPPVLEGDLPY